MDSPTTSYLRKANRLPLGEIFAVDGSPLKVWIGRVAPVARSICQTVNVQLGSGLNKNGIRDTYLCSESKDVRRSVELSAHLKYGDGPYKEGSAWDDVIVYFNGMVCCPPSSALIRRMPSSVKSITYLPSGEYVKLSSDV